MAKSVRLSVETARDYFLRGWTLDGFWLRRTKLDRAAGTCRLALIDGNGRRVVSQDVRSNNPAELDDTIRFTGFAFAKLAMSSAQSVPSDRLMPNRVFWWRLTSPQERRARMVELQTCEGYFVDGRCVDDVPWYTLTRGRGEKLSVSDAMCCPSGFAPYVGAHWLAEELIDG